MVRGGNVRPFVHLRVHSTYSLGVGLSSPADVCVHAQRAGYPAVALSDIHGTYGFVEFHHAARAVGIKPIYAVMVVVDSRIDDAAPPEERHALDLIALDRWGLRNVCAAAGLSASRREAGQSVHVSDLEKFGEGVVCVVSLPSTVTAVLPRTSRSVLGALRSIFRDRLYVESLVHTPTVQSESRRQLETLGQTMHVPPVLCQDVRFVGQEKHQLIDLIGSADDAAPAGEAVKGTHGMLSREEMSPLFDRDEEAFTNASLIASLVQPDILATLGTSDRTIKTLPNLGDGEDARRVFAARVEAAFACEFEGLEGDELAWWRARLDEELEIIRGAELEDTFLQFQEIATRVRAAVGTVGPGSGLRLQSLCAWLLGVTGFNPYRVDEHFRPSFDERDRANHLLDLQVPAGTHDAAADALRGLFDPEGVGYVPSVEHITAARALKMVAPRLEHEPAEFDEVMRIATASPGASLQDLVTQNRRIGFLYKRSALLRAAISQAAAIEGLPFGFVRSRRTMIVSPTPIQDFLGETTHAESGDRFVQSTRDAFPIGSITRVDISTLSALSVCERLGVGARGGAELAWEGAMERRDIYRSVERGEVDGVYLLETDLVQRLAKSFGIASFDDLLCFLALMRYRRGGLTLADRVKAYRDPERGRGEVPEAIRHLVESTNGWVLFHDQLRDIVGAVTGLDPDNAARMARRFARQRPGELAALRREFMLFAVERGTPMEVAQSSFTRILHAAGATVSRQRIIAEALVVSMMLYLNKLQSVRYLAALANVYQRSESKREAYLARLRERTRILAPDINRSGLEYAAENTGVRPPLWSIAGVGMETARKIAAARGGGKIRNRREFDCLIRDNGITYKIVEALVGAGALESVGIPADEKVEPSEFERQQEDTPRGHATGQLEFELETTGSYATDPSTPAEPGSPDSASIPATVYSHNAGNKRVAYHVLPALAEFHPHAIASRIELAGRISDLRLFTTSSGETVALFNLYDETASVPVYVPWERVERSGEPPVDGDRVSVRGYIRMREGRRVCEAVEIVADEGGIDDGQTTPDESAEGDS